MNKLIIKFVKTFVLIFVLFFSVEVVVAMPTAVPGVGTQVATGKTPTTPTPPTQTKGIISQAADAVVEWAAPQGSILATIFPTTKNCNYVGEKLYQPFSGIDKTFPGAEAIGFEEVPNKDPAKKGEVVTCIKVDGGTEGLLKILYTMGISIIIIMSVISISVAGIQFMTEEATGQIKGGAKKRLQNSLIALGLGLLSYTILYTINKQLVTFEFNPGSIDKDGSVDRGLSRAIEATKATPFSISTANIAALTGPSTPNSVYPVGGGGAGNIVDAFNSVGTWNERTAENWVRSLPNGQRSTDGRLVVSVYSATKDSITDSNTLQKRGNANNLLREGSVALSPDLISKYYPQTGQEVFINGTSIGFYEDATAAVYNGVTFRNTVDIYDENGTLGGSYLKTIPAGQWTIGFGTTKRAQIPNPSPKK